MNDKQWRWLDDICAITLERAGTQMHLSEMPLREFHSMVVSLPNRRAEFDRFLPEKMAELREAFELAEAPESKLPQRFVDLDEWDRLLGLASTGASQERAAFFQDLSKIGTDEEAANRVSVRAPVWERLAHTTPNLWRRALDRVVMARAEDLDVNLVEIGDLHEALSAQFPSRAALAPTSVGAEAGPLRAADTRGVEILGSPQAAAASVQTQAAFDEAFDDATSSDVIPTGRPGKRKRGHEGVAGGEVPGDFPQVRRFRSGPLHEAEQSQTSLDRRDNDMQATRRESRFSHSVWENLSPQHIGEMIEDIEHFVECGRLAQNELLASNEPQDLYELFNGEDLFGAADEVSAAMANFQRNAGSMKLAETLLSEEFKFKRLLDLLGLWIQIHRPDFERGRDLPVFEDRGRQSIPQQRVRQESRHSRHGGITNSAYRPESLENVFEQNIWHAKGEYERVAESVTSQKFLASGTPFISGASGTMQVIAGVMEMRGRISEIDAHELSRRERIMLLHAVRQVIGGEHSLMECLIPTQAYGYFGDIPNPLESANGYDEAISALYRRYVERGLMVETSINLQSDRERTGREAAPLAQSQTFGGSG